MQYVVIEMQKGNTLALTTPVVKDTKAEAEQAYHQTLSYASVSTIPVHSVIMLDDEGNMVKAETYRHENQAE